MSRCNSARPAAAAASAPPRRAADDPQTLEHYGRGTPDDWLERRLYGAYPHLGIVVFAAAHLLLFGAPGIVMIAAHLVAQPFFAGGVL
ncbi:MAG TPA: hypothetical protein VLL69_01210, partial [Streptosporangiaceae bacterium]|nr:hypothetical protein [Streptosporangiaceae bacterium]